MASKNFVQLSLRIAQLKNTFIPKESPTGDYSAEEYDFIRAFRVLSHAEVENFVEDLADLLGSTLDGEVKNIRLGNSFSRSFAKISVAKYKNQIGDNHGINSKNLIKLFGIFGFTEETFDKLDSKLLGQMNRFGKERGAVAHNGANRMVMQLNPIREVLFIDEIMGYIALLDEEIRRIRLHGFMR